MQGVGTSGGALERDEELARIRAAFDDAAGGSGRLVVVEGPPGIGKTRVLDEARALAKSLGFARMRATGEEPEQSITWGVVRQLVERSILRYSGEVREAILAGPAGRALEAIERAGDDVDDIQLARTMHALWWVSADLSSERPLLITVDDAQWADAPSLRFLAYLARRLDDLSVCLVVGTRPADPNGPLAELTAGRFGDRLELRPLSAGAVADLAGGAHPEVAAAVHAASGGNPFYAEQLFAELRRQRADQADARTAAAVAGLAPERVARGLLLRLSPDGRALAAAAAVLGTQSAPRVAVALAGLDAAAGAAAGDELRAAHVLADDVLTLQFAHPVVREAVLAGLGAGERAELHGAAARALHAAGAPDERVAAQLALAPVGSLPGAEHLLAGAASRALTQGDATTAAKLLRRVLDEVPADTAAQVQLGFALVRGDDPAGGRELLRSAATRVDDPHERARCRAGAAEATAVLDGPAAAAAELAAARADLGPERSPAALLLDARLAATNSYLLGRAPGSGAHLAQFADLTGQSVDERTLLALLAQRFFNEGRPAAEVREVGRHAFGPDTSAPSGLDLLAGGFAVFALGYAGGLDEVEQVLRSTLTRVRASGAPIDFAVVSAASAQIAWRKGDLGRCAAESAAGLEALAWCDPGPMADGLRAVLVRQAVLTAIERSDLAEADALLASHDVHEPPSTVPVERLREARAALALARDDPRTAHQEAHALRAAEERAGAQCPAVPWRVLAATAALRLDDVDEARELAAEQLAHARRWTGPPEIATALALQARVGDAADRVALLEEAVEVVDGSPARLVLAATLLDLGDALRVAGRRSDAREPLRRAANVADAAGATAMRARALSSLAALGDRPRKLMFSGLEALTAGERRVAELAAVGRSNRDIAQELFITPKTVENHLGRAYAKLGIRGRRELAGAIGAD